MIGIKQTHATSEQFQPGKNYVVVYRRLDPNSTEVGHVERVGQNIVDITPDLSAAELLKQIHAIIENKKKNAGNWEKRVT